MHKISDTQDNCTFVRQMFHDFEIFDGIYELKESVFELCKAFFTDHVSLQDVDIGFVGQKNKKMNIKTDQEVEDAYDRRVFHKNDELVLFIEKKKKSPGLQKKIYQNIEWYVNCYRSLSTQSTFFCS